MPRPPSPLAVAVFLTLALPGVVAAPVATDRGTSFGLEDLAAPARLVVDRWGIPHIRAASLADLYFAWGFVTARDRLWQLEHTRRAASGDLWEWFGNRTLTADGGAQLFRLRERAARIW